jgi:hypothetical protein
LMIDPPSCVSFVFLYRTAHHVFLGLYCHDVLLDLLVFSYVANAD